MTQKFIEKRENYSPKRGAVIASFGFLETGFESLF